MTLRPAKLWLRATIAMTEQALVDLKSRLFDGNAQPADLVGIRALEEYRLQLRQFEGESLVQAYEARRREYPIFVRMMVRAQAATDRAVLHALWQRLEHAREEARP
jgi:hypothetical protein